MNIKRTPIESEEIKSTFYTDVKSKMVRTTETKNAINLKAGDLVARDFCIGSRVIHTDVAIVLGLANNDYGVILTYVINGNFQPAEAVPEWYLTAGVECKREYVQKSFFRYWKLETNVKRITNPASIQKIVNHLNN